MKLEVEAPPSDADRRHMTLVLQEFTHADEILGRYLGPNHKVRQVLAPYLKDLREKLGANGS